MTSEQDLVKGCVDGNRRYQELLYLKFCRKMMGICFRYSKSREEAEDLLQDAFIRIFSKLHQFRNEGSLEGWIRRIVLSTIYDNFRKKNHLLVLSEWVENAAALEDNSQLEDTDFEELIVAIRELSPGYRTVFNMYAIEGYTHKEIAARLGISEGTSKSQYSGARRILQQKLKIYNRSAELKIK